MALIGEPNSRSDIARKIEARWSGVSGGRRMRAGFLLQEEKERVKGHSLLDSTAQSSGIRRYGESKIR